MKTNRRARNELKTHGGATAAIINPEQQLRRSVMSCLLFENEFYEEGEEIAGRIKKLAEQVDPFIVAAVADEARNVMHLRHAPLLLLEVLSRTGAGRFDHLVANTIASVIQRADEMAEFIALYTHGGDRRKAEKGHGRQFSAQVMRGLALAFRKFDDYQLAKYDRDGAVKLKDVLRIVRPKPADEAEAERWKAAREGKLATPDTWEVALSAGKDKKETFERLLREKKLGYLALLRNLRNMAEAKVDQDLIREAILLRKGAARVLPFRFIAAARVVPQFEPWLDKAFVSALADMSKLKGKTVVVVDVSGSMYHARLSAKSDMTRIDAACALAAIARGLFEDVRIFATAGSDGLRRHATAEVPARHGMALIDAISSQRIPLGGGGIFLKQAMDWLRKEVGEVDRVIVVTDEQDCDLVNKPQSAQPIGKEAYVINVASAKNGIGYGRWTHIDGFSENVFRFMREFESVNP